MDLKACRGVKEILNEVDLALITMPAKPVPGLPMEFSEKGISGAVTFSSGFAGIGNYELDKQLRETIKKFGVRAIGSNTLGVCNLHMGMSAAFAGGTAPICQGGKLGWKC